MQHITNFESGETNFLRTLRIIFENPDLKELWQDICCSSLNNCTRTIIIKVLIFSQLSRIFSNIFVTHAINSGAEIHSASRHLAQSHA